MNKFKLSSALLAAFVLAACSQGNDGKEQTNNSSTVNVTSESSEKEISSDSSVEEGDQYYDALKKYVSDINKIKENSNLNDAVSKGIDTNLVNALNEESDSLKNIKADFENSIKDIDMPKDDLEVLLNRYVDTSTLTYDEMAKNVKVGAEDEAYELASQASVLFVSSPFAGAMQELSFDLDNYGKEVLDAIVGEEEANKFQEFLYVGDDDVEEINKSLAMIAIKVSQDGIPADAPDKLITPGFTMKLYETSGMNDETKEVPAGEYNDSIEKFNHYMPQLLILGTIDQPTTTTVNNDLIGKWNTVNQVFSENNIEVPE